MMSPYQQLLNYLKGTVRGKGHVFWKRKLLEETGLSKKEKEVSESLNSLVSEGYLTSEWILTDLLDESHKLSVEEVEATFETGELYHPMTGEKFPGDPSKWLRQDFLATEKLASCKKLSLKPGRFYKDRAGNLWCCYDYFGKDQVICVAVRSSRGGRIRERTETFFNDGRYDVTGTRDFCLVKEVDFPYGR